MPRATGCHRQRDRCGRNPDAIASPVSCSKLSALQSGRLGRRALHFNADHDNDVMVSWPFNDSLSQTVVSQFKVR
jgi:hypothetical protein